MNDLERIQHIENKLGIKLHRVSLENLFTEKVFLTNLDYILSYVQNPYFPYKGTRNYSLDEDGNVTGLALDFCNLLLLEDNYLTDFKYLEKLKLKNTYLSNYSFLVQLENLKELDLSNNGVSSIDFLKELTGLTSLNLNGNKLPNYDFLKELTGLTSLNLSGNKLSNYNFLKELTGLMSLDLSHNDISNYDFLRKLTALTSLDLSGNSLSNNLDFLTELTALTSLDLHYNKLPNYDFIKELASLTSLYLSHNGLSNVVFLKELTGLTLLDLSGNELSNVDFLTELTGLTSLYLENSNLSNYDFLTELTGLTSLDLSNNELSNSDFLGKLTGLTSLDLSSNKLSNVDFLKEVTGLTSLNLSHNKLSNYDFLRKLTALTSLKLNSSNLSNVEFLKELTGLTSLKLGSNPDLPNFGIDLDSFLDREKIETIIKFYEDLAEQGKEYIYEAKVLIIGQPRAGKTTLFRKMLNPAYKPQEATEEEKRSTLGINIETFPFDITTNDGKEKKFTSYLWDFGGQDIQYVLHQYFLTERSLYVFLYNVGSEDEKTNYWFEIIASLGKDCPVLIVLNYKEIEKTRPSNFAIDTYRKEFADKIKDITEKKVDFNMNDGDWNDLYQTIKNKVSCLEHIGRDFLPKKTVEVRDLLVKLDEPIIGIDAYYDVCLERQIEKTEAETILNRLHEFGVALWYKGDDNLKHKVILKPNWVIDALYIVLKEDRILNNNGNFHSQLVFDLWENYNYDEKVFLLSLMQKGVFSTAYKLQGKENQYIVPALLTEKRPVYEFNEENLIQIYFKYDFMPDGIISRLIVELNEYIHSENDKQIVWRKGAVLKEKNSFAEIAQSTRNNRITIKVSGDDKLNNRELLSEIRRELKKIHKQSFKDRLTVDEFIPCPCQVCRQRRKFLDDLPPDEYRNLSNAQKEELESQNFKFRDLINWIINLKREEIPCYKSGELINVRELLGEIYVENKNERESMSEKNKYNIEQHFHGNASFALGDYSTANQNFNAADYKEISEKLNAMVESLNDAQANEIEELTDRLIKRIDEEFVKTNKLTETQAKEFAEVKRKFSSDWKIKAKQGVPFEWFIKQLTGFSVEIEKEWKMSKEIKPENFISNLKRFVLGDKLQITDFNRLEEPQSGGKSLKE